jgi:8-oxo-dGTP pyrophosphatase MutT (NUDIX family)
MCTEDTSTDIKAAGGLVWREIDGQPRLAVVHRASYDDWSLPKGKLKPGEDFTAAALREVQEETGCTVRLGQQAGIVRYRVNGMSKEVRFWHMFVEGECQFTPSSEVDRLEWLSVEEALNRLDYPGEKAIVRVTRSSRT